MGKHFSFIHCADLHLGEPFGGVRLGTKGPWNEQIGKATFKAFERVVDAALENRVDAILISGDVYNSDHHSLAAQMAFGRELYRAAQAGIEVFIVHGNHDPGEAWRADIPLPETVHIFSSEEVTGIPLMKDGEKAATIYGISYKTRHTKDDLVRSFHVNPEDGFTIGMLHTEAGVDGSTLCALHGRGAEDCGHRLLGTGACAYEKDALDEALYRLPGQYAGAGYHGDRSPWLLPGRCGGL